MRSLQSEIPARSSNVSISSYLFTSVWKHCVPVHTGSSSMAIDADVPRMVLLHLRHSAVSDDVNVNAVQSFLEHSTESVTFNVFAELFDVNLDGVAMDF